MNYQDREELISKINEVSERLEKLKNLSLDLVNESDLEKENEEIDIEPEGELGPEQDLSKLEINIGSNEQLGLLKSILVDYIKYSESFCMRRHTLMAQDLYTQVKQYEDRINNLS